VNPDVISEPSRDPYSVLGLSRQAGDEDIKRAYFQLVRQFSPERAPEKFREIRTAYEQLRDPENRARLGLFLVQPPPPLPKQRRPSYDLSVHVEDLLTLAMELVRTPMQDDFSDIT
jgi:curved DNA-binding protein CbpA